MRIGFFGAGNMVSAFAHGIYSKSKEHQFYFYTPSKNKALELANATNGFFVDNISEMPRDLDWYVLGFKPINLQDFHFSFPTDAKIISFLAGTSVETIHKKINVEKILRVMPNTPSKVYEGMNLLYFTKNITESDQGQINNLFTNIGKHITCDNEEDLDFLTPYSGSGPGIFFELLTYFEKSIPPEIARKYDVKNILAQTMYGSAKLILESKESIAELRGQVTSKKGVTIEAIYELRDHNVDNIFAKSMYRALNRLNEMKKES